MLLTYHASHEQFSPSALLAWSVEAEQAGFDGVFCSDHLQPWSPSQGHSGFAWAWLGAAMQATRHLPFSCITVPCGWRYHPVVLAQAIASLAEMFPGRLPWLAFGSGEAVNEAGLTGAWPAKQERQLRLREGVDLVRALLSGRQVQHQGLMTAMDVRLWETPANVPHLFGAAVTEATAHGLGDWADGLLTLGRDLAQLARVIRSFRDGGGHGKPVHVKLDLSWHPDQREAVQQAHAHWRFNALGGEANADLRQPEHFEWASRFIQPEHMHQNVLIINTADQLLAHLSALRSMGVASVDIHQVSVHQSLFIEGFGRDVVPAYRAAGQGSGT
ncbi:MAG: TIGR03885 family FMN-dependent LLM class oxidoreductase [Rubrivivax sp.]|nr:MAG: TIGR03885 family FMN-dependent LLM class oxidoreductase [Rubrivivax sp.]